jgi:hypothetical protein
MGALVGELEHAPEASHRPLPTRHRDYLLSLALAADSDRWPAAIVEHVFQFAALHRTGRVDPPEEGLRRLRAALDRIAWARGSGEVTVADLQSILKLPLWERRHELFGAWMLTQLIDAFLPYEVDLELEGSVLRFEFKAKRMARLRWDGPETSIWCELRTPLAKPVGKGRRGHVQPDYSLLHHDAAAPAKESSILEVECKQYLRPDAGGFAAALSDYARGRPRASVVLVTAGRANPDTILRRVPAEVRDRAHVVTEMRPDNTQATTAFREALWAACAPYIRRRVRLPLAAPAFIHLRRLAIPVDVELALYYESPDEETIAWVSFRTGRSEGVNAIVSRRGALAAGPIRRFRPLIFGRNAPRRSIRRTSHSCLRVRWNEGGIHLPDRLGMLVDSLRGLRVGDPAVRHRRRSRRLVSRVVVHESHYDVAVAWLRSDCVVAAAVAD